MYTKFLGPEVNDLPHCQGPYDLDLKKGVDFGLKNSVYLDLNSFALSNFDLKPKLCQQCT